MFPERFRLWIFFHKLLKAITGFVPAKAESTKSVTGVLIFFLWARVFTILALFLLSAMNVSFGIFVMCLEASNPMTRLRLLRLKAVVIISPKHAGPKSVSSFAPKILTPISRASSRYREKNTHAYLLKRHGIFYLVF